MPRVLLTGGSGFIAAHVLETLIKHGHSVVTTVRSQEKADQISEAYQNVGKDKLSFAIVEDIAQEGAFEKAVVSDPPFEYVIHTASPFHFKVTDIQKELLDPAVIGTTGILRSIKKHAPTVKRVVVTSSFAAIVNPFESSGSWPGHTYSEKDWNPINQQQALENPAAGYRGSKTLAEKAAWDFVEKEKPNFDLVTMNPPLVFGPVVHYLNSLDALNTSNQTVAGFIQGKYKEEYPPGAVPLWIDVRDLALAHVKSIETPSAGGKRFFVTAGYYEPRQIADIIRKNFPEYKDKLPAESVKGGVKQADFAKYDNTRVKELLGAPFTSLETSMVDLVKSLKKVGA